MEKHGLPCTTHWTLPSIGSTLRNTTKWPCPRYPHTTTLSPLVSTTVPLPAFISPNLSVGSSFGSISRNAAEGETGGALHVLMSRRGDRLQGGVVAMVGVARGSSGGGHIRQVVQERGGSHGLRLKVLRQHVARLHARHVTSATCWGPSARCLASRLYTESHQITLSAM